MLALLTGLGPLFEVLIAKIIALTLVKTNIERQLVTFRQNLKYCIHFYHLFGRTYDLSAVHQS